MEMSTEHHAPAPLPQRESRKFRVGLDKLAKRKVTVLLSIKHHIPAKSSHCRTTPVLEAEAGNNFIKTGQKL